MIPKEVFLSHASDDRESAELIANTLRAHGLPVWYSQTNIMSAQDWHDEIGNALRRCDWFLLLLTDQSIESVWVKRELSYALRHSQYVDHILSVKLVPCDAEQLSWTLDEFQTVTVNGDWDTAFTNILRAWGLGFAGPAPAQ